MAPFLAACQTPDSGLDGCFYWIDETAARWSLDEWRQEVAFMQRAGFEHVIVSGPAYGVAAGQQNESIQAFDRLMTACEPTDMLVYPAIWAHWQWFARWDLVEEIETNKKVLALLTARCGGHPNLGGWYIPHEIYITWDDKTAFMVKLYGQLSKLCKQHTPDKKVLISPFFILDRHGYLGDFRFVEPAEYERFWYELVRRTEIDVVALQDSGEHLSFYTLEDRRPFFEAMKRACDRAGKTLWGNVETGELYAEGYEDYVSRFGAKTHVNDPKTRSSWRPVPAEKLRRKARFARRFADTIITWGYREYWDPMRGEPARSVYNAYLASGLATAARR